MLFESKDEDYKLTIEYIDTFLSESKYDLEVILDERILNHVINIMYYDGLYLNGDLAQTSVFKKVAVFVSYFVAEKPLKLKTKNDSISSFVDIPFYENAVIAFEIARDSLWGATIRRHDDNKVVLDKRIAISEHSYVELINAMSKLSSDSYLIIAVLLEQMAYRANPECSYPVVC